MDNCSFHPCVRYVPLFTLDIITDGIGNDRYKKWNKDHVLSFIPPDGHFDLLKYEAVQPSVKGVGAGSKGFPLPLVFKPELKLEEAGGTFRPLLKESGSRFLISRAGKFSLTLSSRVNARPIENIVVSLYLGANVHHVSATPSGDSRGIGSGGGAGGAAVLGCVGGGTWEFDPNRRVCRGVERRVIGR
jgi:AP-3 complex subunit mu